MLLQLEAATLALAGLSVAAILVRPAFRRNGTALARAATAVIAFGLCLCAKYLDRGDIGASDQIFIIAFALMLLGLAVEVRKLFRQDGATVDGARDWQGPSSDAPSMPQGQ